MDFITIPDQLKGVWDSVANGFLTFEAPVPDSALLAGFLVALATQRIASRRTFARVHDLYHDAFNSEVLNANRKAYQARAALDRAEKEIERSRQKERRAKRPPSARPRRARPPSLPMMSWSSPRPSAARPKMPRRQTGSSPRPSRCRRKQPRTTGNMPMQ